MNGRTPHDFAAVAGTPPMRMHSPARRALPARGASGTDLAVHDDAATPRAEAPAKRRSKLRAEILFVLIAVLGGLHVVVMTGLEIDRYLHTTTEITRLERDVALLQFEIAELDAILQHGHDPAYRESLARLQGFVHPNELRFVTLPRY